MNLKPQASQVRLISDLVPFESLFFRFGWDLQSPRSIAEYVSLLHAALNGDLSPKDVEEKRSPGYPMISPQAFLRSE
jgi:hypothetical protein